MTNAILASEPSLLAGGLSTSKLIVRESKPSSAETATRGRRHIAIGGRTRGRMFDQSLLGGLLDAKTSSLSLNALAHAAAYSGKRLVIEIRDDNPVRIVRTDTTGN